MKSALASGFAAAKVSEFVVPPNAAHFSRQPPLLPLQRRSGCGFQCVQAWFKTDDAVHASPVVCQKQPWRGQRGWSGVCRCLIKNASRAILISANSYDIDSNLDRHAGCGHWQRVGCSPVDAFGPGWAPRWRGPAAPAQPGRRGLAGHGLHALAARGV